MNFRAELIKRRSLLLQSDAPGVKGGARARMPCAPGRVEGRARVGRPARKKDMHVRNGRHPGKKVLAQRHAQLVLPGGSRRELGMWGRN